MKLPPDTPHYKRPYEPPSTPAHFQRAPSRKYPMPAGRTITNPRTVVGFVAAIREYRAHREAAKAAPPPDDRFDGPDLPPDRPFTAWTHAPDRPFMTHAHATAPKDVDDLDDGPDLT